MEQPVPLLRPVTELSSQPLLKYPESRLECQVVWHSLSPGQQQAIFHHVVTICLQLAGEATATPAKEGAYDRQ